MKLRLMLVTLAAGLCAADAVDAADHYRVNPGNSSVMFRIKNRGVTFFYGRFNDFSGNFTLNADEPAKSSIEMTVKATSIDTNSRKRDDHLRTPEFFNVAKFAEISFKSKSAKKTGENEYEISGDMTLLGVTRPLSVKVTHTGTRGNFSGFETKFTIKRSDFGMNKFIPGIGDEVHLFVSVEGTKQAPASASKATPQTAG